MLTDLQIAKLPWKMTRYVICFPGRGGPGLRLAVHPRGRKTWRLYVNIFTKPAVLTLGYWPEMTVKAARKRSQAMLEAIRRGEDPRKTKLTGATVTVQAFAKRWIREVVSKARKDEQPIERRLERDVLPQIGSLSLKKVTLEDVRKLVFAKRDGQGRPAAAVALRDLLWRMFEYARVNGLVEMNPAAPLERKFIARLKSTTRSLSEAELRLLFQRMGDLRLGLRHAAAIQLLLLTLARKSELLQARWRDIDFQTGTWEVPAELSKSGRPHVVYLSGAALELFHSQARACSRLYMGRYGYLPEWFVFPAQNSSTQPMAPNALNKAILRVKWGMPAFTPHDLRRTASTLLNEKGYPPDVIEKALNHAVRGGVRGVYNRAQYAAERKQMLQEWADYLGELHT
jgi:integrase